jgi:O-antigen biosynthesis protein
MSFIAPPQQLYDVLGSILTGRGWRYLRYLHFRTALQMAEGTRTVLSIGAGKGLAEVALALEHPHIEFTISERRGGLRGLRRAKKLARRLGLRNVRFMTLDLLGRRLPFRNFDFVAAVDTLQYIQDPAPAAAKMAQMSSGWVYCQVPFAEEARRKNEAARERAFKEFGHYCLGYDVNQLVRLFPEPVAIRGCLWSDAGQRLRERLHELSDEQIKTEADRLLEQAEADSRPGWQGDRAEAQGIWILSRSQPQPLRSPWEKLKAFVGLGVANPYSRTWEKLDDRRLVEVSGLFDADFYRRSVDDASMTDPLGDYLRRPEAGGWPNPQFDSAYYARTHRIDSKARNPLAHYILEGRARRLRTVEDPRSAAEARYATVTTLHPQHSAPAREAPQGLAIARPMLIAAGAPIPIAAHRSASEIRAAIEASGLFDPEFYRAHNPDIVKRQVEPLGHYLRSGAREGRNPNPLFDTRYYAALAKLDAGSMNPLFHYLSEGEARGLTPSIRFEPTAYGTANPSAIRPGRTLLAYALRELREQRAQPKVQSSHAHLAARPVDVDLRQLAITVVVPVYNGGEHVRRCIDSVLAETHLPQVELLILDDASPDTATTEILNSYLNCPNVRIRRNPENFGFTRNVNTAFASESGRDIVLLNSDTVVGPRWLEHLALAAHSGSRIASATALSDNAGAFSTPDVEYNATHSRVGVPTAARLSRRAAPQAAEPFATGNGFCMYIRHEALREVGDFDAGLFPRGYGEENDWCMRANELGFRHVLALRSYVMHVNAVSFGTAKTQLRQDARRVLDARHPDYTQQLKAGIANAQGLRIQRATFANSLSSVAEAPVLPRILYVTSTRTGGVPQTNGDLMRGIGSYFAPMLLQCNSTEMTLVDASALDQRVVETHHLHERVSIRKHISEEYDATVRDWLLRYDIELLHIRHIAWHGLGLVRVAKSLGIPVVFSFHDFYTLCPSVNLIGGHGRWSAEGVCEPHIVAPLWRETDPEGMQSVLALNAKAFLDSWRRRMSLMIDQCDALVSTSRSAKALIQAQLPAALRHDDAFHVIPHGRDFDTFLETPATPNASERLRVLVPGNISDAKGLGTLLKVLELDVGRALELHVLGACPASLAEQPGVVNHGRYRREQFFELVQKIRPHVSAILSICPETFCHTLTESWAAGLPVVGSELGAVGERIAVSQAGWVVDPLDAVAVFQTFLDVRGDETGFATKTRAVRKWQQEVGRTRTIAAMSDDYLDLYRRVRSGTRLLPVDGRRATGRPRVALLAQGHYPEAPATVHVRLATLVEASTGGVSYDWTDPREFVRTALDYDGAIVCRNAADGGVLEQVARVSRSRRLPLVVDLDDDLLNVPPDKDVAGIYSSRVEGLKAVLRASSLTTVSTRELASCFEGYAERVSVSPNMLDPKLWFCPVEPSPAPAGVAEDAKLKVLYVGSPTHAEDLSVVLPVFQKLGASHGIVLHVVGVENTDRRGYVRLRAPERRYDRFVPWLRSLAPHFDVAIAPLVDTPFNRRKSALKFMEYAACGIATIASRVPPYLGVVTEGTDGLLAQDEDAWEQHLLRLLRDAAFRRQLASAALTRSGKEFLCRGNSWDSLSWRSQSPLPVSDLR